jgi:hypothetical protein
MLGVMIENAMQMIGREAVRQPLGVLPVGDPQKGVVGGDKLDPRSAELAGQPGMAVAIELQPERTPGWHPQMDQSQLCIHEVEVVVQAFAAVRLEKGLAGLLVVPGLVGVAGLHGRDHMHQAGMIPPLVQYLGDHLFLANVALGDVLDRNPSLARNRRCLLTHSITQRRSKLRVVENAYALRIKNVGHAPRKARPWKRPGNQNTIVAGQHTRDMLAIPFRQRTSHPASPTSSAFSPMITLFGSGFAGFGCAKSPCQAPALGTDVGAILRTR